MAYLPEWERCYTNALCGLLCISIRKQLRDASTRAWLNSASHWRQRPARRAARIKMVKIAGGLLFVSGQLPSWNGELRYVGKSVESSIWPLLKRRRDCRRSTFWPTPERFMRACVPACPGNFTVL